MGGDALIFAVGVMCVASVGFGLALAAVVVVARRRALDRRRRFEALASAWGLRSELRRRPDELSPVAGALMRGALLLGGGRRWVGVHEGRGLELVLRGEVGSVEHQRPMAPTRRSPVRFDYIHLRMGRRRPTGFAYASRAKQTHEVVAALGPPAREDAAGLLWAHDVADASARVARLPASAPFALFVDDAWVVVEDAGTALDAARLEAMRALATQVADLLDA